MTKEILLTKGKVALVDDDVYESLSQLKYHYNARGYAARYVSAKNSPSGKEEIVFMHNDIMKPPPGMRVDHICSQETLNNTRENLRLCTSSQNNANAVKHSNNKSGFKGVCWNKYHQAYQAQIGFGGRPIHLGYFKIPEDAARTYDAKALELYGPFAKTNF